MGRLPDIPLLNERDTTEIITLPFAQSFVRDVYDMQQYYKQTARCQAYLIAAEQYQLESSQIHLLKNG